MGRSQADKEATHTRIVQTAAERFREVGIDGLSIADLMNDAGLTHGGFYKHFDSRDDLVAEAVDMALEQGQARIDAFMASDSKEPTLATLLDVYLSRVHRDSPSTGCAVAGLASDVARNDPRARKRYTEQVSRNLRLIGPLTEGRRTSDKRTRAIVVLSAIVGALNLARAVSDKALSDEILSTVRDYLKKEI